MKLSELFNVESNTEITGISIDSRLVKPQDMFFCVIGTQSDGHTYVNAAIEAGAVAIVHSEDIPKREGIEYIKVDDTTDELNRVCNIFYGKPSEDMTIFAVTGTNGKSTIATIIKNIYSHHIPTGYVGTIGVEYGNYTRYASLTTPSQVELHQLLAQMHSAGIKACAIEASSHGLTQKRTDSIDIDCAIFTQLTHEHLDYHKTLENYLEAKMILFKNIKKSGVAVLNADDDISFEKLKECCNCRYVTYGLRDDVEADYKAGNIVLGPRYTDFTLTHAGKSYQVRTNLIAEYNVSNILAVISAVCEFGMTIEELIPLLNNIPQVAGRMEVIDEGQDFNVICDFAHTPDAFEKVFAFTKDVIGEKAKVYSVFASSGRRDTAKRPVMGKIAGDYCDEIVISQDDPRDEDPADIAQEIMAGVTNENCVRSFIRDREEAIDYIINKAEKDDLILLLGMGRQPYLMQAGNIKKPYIGDHQAARNSLKRRLK